MTKTQLHEKTPLDLSPEIVKSIIKETLLESEAPITEISQYLTESQGKNLRARLLLVSSADDSGFVPKNALISAAALEILHLASLVHDDVIDDAETRRGRASLRKVFGNKPAVICGDYLFCKSFLLVADISSAYQDRFKDAAKAMTRICLGELREYQHNKDTSLSVRDYFRIVAGKTSSLFALSMYTGTTIGGRSEAEARRLARFGHYVGMLFQLTDDCIDYQTEGSIAGKSIHHDLKEGTVTLPLIFAMAKEPALRDEVGKGVSPKLLLQVVNEVIALGGVDMTMEVADRYGAKAAKLLEALPDGLRRSQLAFILEHIRSRKY